MIKAIVFDMDGVIIDSETICVKCWKKAAEELQLDPKKEPINRCFGMNRSDTVQVLKEFYGQNFDGDSYLNRTSELFHEIEFSTGIPLMPYARECLEKLNQDKKYRIALASSTRGSTVERQLGKLDLLKYFETRTTGEMVEHSKPNPDIYLLACKSLGLKSEECIAVEDSPNGIKSAYAAGLKCVMIPDKVQPTPEIEKLCWKIVKNLKEFLNVL